MGTIFCGCLHAELLPVPHALPAYSKQLSACRRARLAVHAALDMASIHKLHKCHVGVAIPQPTPIGEHNL